jgi:hypothetical protein
LKLIHWLSPNSPYLGENFSPMLMFRSFLLTFFVFTAGSLAAQIFSLSNFSPSSLQVSADTFALDIDMGKDRLNPIIAYFDDGAPNSLMVKERVGGAWSDVGMMPISTDINFKQVQLASHYGSGELYLCYINDARDLNFVHYDGSVWTEYLVASAVNYDASRSFALTVDQNSGLPYIVYETSTFDLKVVYFDGTVFVPVGATLLTNANILALSFDINSTGEMFVSFFLSGSAQVYKFNGSWSNFSAGLPTGMGPSTFVYTMSDEKPLVIHANFNGNELDAYKHSGSVWQNWETANPIRTNLFSSEFESAKSIDDVVYLFFKNGLGQAILCDSKQPTGATLENISAALGGPISNNLRVVANKAGYAILACRSFSGEIIVGGYCQAAATFNAQPVGINTACQGDNISFSVNLDAGTNTFPFEYQWTANGTPIVGETGLTLNLTAQNTDSYRCSVFDGCELLQSNAAKVTTLLTPPAIATAPSSPQDFCEGQNLYFDFELGGGTPDSYLWQKDGSTPVGTNSFFEISSITTADAGSYTCELSNVCGAFTSDPIVVTVSTLRTVNTSALQNACGNGLPITLTGTTLSGGTLLWTTLGDGSFDDATLLGAKYTPGSIDLTNGSVDLSVETTNNGACLSSPSPKTITLAAVPSISGGTGLQTICNSSASSIAQSVTIGNASSLTWTTTGTGTFAPSTTSLSITYSYSGLDLTLDTLFLRATTTGLSICPQAQLEVPIVIEKTPSFGFTVGNATICDDRFVLENYTVTNPLAYQWTTDGDGFFIPNDQVANPIYVAGPADLSDGNAGIVGATAGNVACFSASDFFSLNFNQANQPSLDAGADVVVTGTSVNLNASVANAGAITWISTGNGTFDANTVANPTYTLGSSDLADGGSELLIKVVGTGACTDVVLIDTLTLSLSSTNNISGNAGAPFARVRLYKRINNFLSLFKTTIADASGNYSFSAVPNGVYWLGALQGNPALPYYLGDVYDWNASNSLTLNDNSLTGQNIGTAPNPRGIVPADTIAKYFTGGNDLITGIINLVFPSNLRTASGGEEKPIQDATVYLQNADGSTRLDVTTTDSNGVYSFTGLNGQTYSIQVEYPGTVYAVNPPSTTSIDGNSQTVNVVNAAMIKAQATSSAIQTYASTYSSALSLYPNPAETQVVVNGLLWEDGTKAYLYSSSGQLIEVLAIVPSGTQTMALRWNSGPKPGMYFVRITHENGTSSSLPVMIK